MNNEHDMNWENFDVLRKQYNLQKRLLAEMLYIKKQGNNDLNKMSDLQDYPMCCDVVVYKL